MDLLKMVLGCALALSLVAGGAAQDYRTELSPVAPAQTPAQAPALAPAQAPMQAPMQDMTNSYAPPEFNSLAPGMTWIDPSYANNPPPKFDVTVETLLWRLEPLGHQTMFLVQDTPAPGPIVGSARTDQLDLGLGVGPKISVEYMSDDSEFLRGAEVGYYGIYDWTASRMFTAAPGTSLRLPDTLGNLGTTVDYSNASSMQGNYQSNLTSLEFNLLFGTQKSPFETILGVRYFNVKEAFVLDAFDTPPALPAHFSYYDITTNNNLYGIQTGGRGRWTVGRWEFTGLAKFGVFDEQADQTNLLTDDNRTVVLRNTGASKSQAAFMAEANLSVAYQLTRTWKLRGGYGAMWINRVARATDQLDFTNNSLSGSTLFSRQGELADGANVGLEARW
jgi:hypothetical protein